jgi:hypothetical protein
MVTVGTEATGSFHIIAYDDSNGNGTFQEDDECFSVLNLALVEVEVRTFSPVGRPANIAQSNLNVGGVTVSTGQFTLVNIADTGFSIDSDIRLTGGGADRALGVDQVDVFFMQNFTGDSFTCNYTNGRTVREAFTCSGTPNPICMAGTTLMPFPIVDNNGGNNQGGDTVGAPCCRRETPDGFTAMRDRSLRWIDSPAFSCTGMHVCPGVAETLQSTMGNNAFAVHMLAYGQHAIHSYVVLATGQATVTIAGGVMTDPGTGNLVWTDSGSDIAAAGAAVTAQRADTASIMVYNPVAPNNLVSDGR